MTVKELWDDAKRFYEDNEDNYYYIGVRFEDKQREIGETCENSKDNPDREDEREYPEYGTEEYDELWELNGASAWDVSEEHIYRHNVTDRDKDKLASKVYFTKHCYLVVGDNSMDTGADYGEIVIKDAKVVKQYF